MSGRPTPEERRAAAGAVRHHLGVEALAIERISPRADRHVYLARVPGGAVVLKVLQTRKARSVGCNFAAERLARAGVPTPRVLAVDRSARKGPGDFFDRPFVILEKAPGVPLDTWLLERRPPQAELDQILRQLGVLLRSIHSIRVRRGFGAIDDEGVGAYASWGDYLEKRYVRRVSGERVRVLALDRLCEEGLLAPRQAHLIGDLFAERQEVTEPSLLHNDLTLKNVFVDPRRLCVTAILDLHNAIAGDPALELARFYYFYRGRGHYQPLLSGYGEDQDASDGRQRLYLVYVLLEKLTWLRGREEQFPGRLESDLALLRNTLGDEAGR